MYSKLVTFLILLSILLLPEFASSTKMKSSWKNPSATAESLKFKKVLVVAVIKHEFTRKVAEDRIVQIIEAGGMARAVPSYTVLPQVEVEDQERAKAKISELSFDGVVMLRLAGFGDEKKYDPGSDWERYNNFWGVYYPGWAAVYNATEPDDVRVYIETLLYSLKENKLIWSGITETKNPKNPAKVVEEIAKETAKYLVKEGLIAKRKR